MRWMIDPHPCCDLRKQCILEVLLFTFVRPCIYTSKSTHTRVEIFDTINIIQRTRVNVRAAHILYDLLHHTMILWLVYVMTKNSLIYYPDLAPVFTLPLSACVTRSCITRALTRRPSSAFYEFRVQGKSQLIWIFSTCIMNNYYEELRCIERANKVIFFFPNLQRGIVDGWKTIQLYSCLV